MFSGLLTAASDQLYCRLSPTPYKKGPLDTDGHRSIDSSYGFLNKFAFAVQLSQMINYPENFTVKDYSRMSTRNKFVFDCALSKASALPNSHFPPSPLEHNKNRSGQYRWTPHP
jgi:hypothetical protein